MYASLSLYIYRERDTWCLILRWLVAAAVAVAVAALRSTRKLRIRKLRISESRSLGGSPGPRHSSPYTGPSAGPFYGSGTFGALESVPVHFLSSASE